MLHERICIKAGFNPVCTKYRANPAYTCERGNLCTNDRTIGRTRLDEKS